MNSRAQRLAEIVTRQFENRAIVGYDRHHDATRDRRLNGRLRRRCTLNDEFRRLLRGAIVNPQRKSAGH